MFKIAFPWAKAEEEKNEREYLKAREHTSEEEVAGNVWISPAFGMFGLVFRSISCLTFLSSP
jgi:hypothetical protein